MKTQKGIQLSDFPFKNRAKKDITKLSDIGIIYYFLGKKADFNQKIFELLPDKSPKLIQELEKKYQLQY